ncbi:hypothetical protein RFI_38259 [Reticulomyxa filosa]|uniref:Uncharacterized protein n=1 Tax=Reticulomyxa filosa TaxID=46433 RepID=X6LB17_RETFI|nr:hypothetical protein RFI_38259 [Reticulomyxa filosa]|eukprot:ETN99222.1 hypothetical protein RFI_38259 [Reticulomyxa filosa]
MSNIKFKIPNFQLGTILVMSLSYNKEDENKSQEDGDNNPIKKKKADHNLVRVYVTIISFGSIRKYFFLLFLRFKLNKKKDPS